jgi:hypothetical protein
VIALPGGPSGRSMYKYVAERQPDLAPTNSMRPSSRVKLQRLHAAGLRDLAQETTRAAAFSRIGMQCDYRSSTVQLEQWKRPPGMNVQLDFCLVGAVCRCSSKWCGSR